jgi:hypothetical protein
MTDHAIGAYHLSRRGVQHYVITFVSNLWQVGGFLLALRFPPPIKLGLFFVNGLNFKIGGFFGSRTIY